MDQRYEMTFRPADDMERRAFEGVLHEFVEIVSHQPEEDSSSIFASYDTPRERWLLSFESRDALECFRRFWAKHAERSTT